MMMNTWHRRITDIEKSMKEESPVILYDGLCNFCNAVVNFVVHHDKKKEFRFAPLQSKEARALLREHNEAFVNLKTVYLVEKGEVYKRSTAVFRVFRRLDYPYKILSFFRVLPVGLTDYFYKIIAKYRYALFGKRNESTPVDEEVKARLLNRIMIN
jgi:predicted DCC family thiol-disulfide oxidoreductase YuxK